MNGPSKRINVALYGVNGHQVHERLVNHPRARLVAVAAFPRDQLPLPLRVDATIRVYGTLAELLADPGVDLVVLCSPCRRRQAREAVCALQAGKHVYAEKPCAFDETELDAILHAAERSGRVFREMAGTAFEQPYWAMREIVRSGCLGRIVQVIAEKSYPYHDRRPQDEDIDGGLVRQCAVHAVRMVEQVAGVRVQAVHARETTAGNPVDGGGLRMAAGLLFELVGGGVASITANYLNPPGTGMWGYETLRILGERGFVESTGSGRHTRLVIGDRDCGQLDLATPGLDYFDALLATLNGTGRMPLTLEEELSPTRWVLRAKQHL